MENHFESEKPQAGETVDLLVKIVDRLDLGFMEMHEEMRAGFQAVAYEFGEVKSDISEIRSDVSTLKSDVAVLKSDVRRIEVKTDRLEAKLDDVAETLAETVGDHERRLVVLETVS